MPAYIVGDVVVPDFNYLVGTGLQFIDFSEILGAGDSFTPTPAFPFQWNWNSDTGLLIVTTDTAQLWPGTMTRTLGATAVPSAAFNIAVNNRTTFLGPDFGDNIGGSPTNNYRANNVGDTISIPLSARFMNAVSIALSNGSLPSGLSIDSSFVLGGVLTTAQTRANMQFTGVGPGENALSDVFDWIISAVLVPPVLVAPLATPIALARNVAASIDGTTQFTGATSYQNTGTLPTGMTRTGGVVSGTPTVAATYTFSIDGINGDGTTPGPLLTVVVSSAAPIFSGSISDITGTIGALISIDVSSHYTSATGYSGALTNGLSIDKFGHITGTLSGPPGTTSGVTVSGINASGSTPSNPFSITANPGVESLGIAPDWQMFVV